MPLKPGDVITAELLNRIERGAFGSVKGGKGIRVNNFGTGGITISATGEDNLNLGIIVAAGPASEADLTGPQYWVQTAYISNTESDAASALVAMTAEATDTVDWDIVAVTNLAEVSPDDATTGTHTLRAGALVVYWSEWDVGSPSTLRYYMSVGGAAAVAQVKVLATAGGAGVYTGTIWDTPDADVDPATDLTEDQLGTAGVECIILNRREVGGSGWILDFTGTYQPMIFLGNLIRTNTDGTPVYAIDGLQTQGCTT